jgi:tetratricopeptide (TPR) repeat protein
MKKTVFLILCSVFLVSCAGLNENEKSDSSEQQPEPAHQETFIEAADNIESDAVGDAARDGDTGQKLQTQKPRREIDVEDYQRERGTAEFHFKRGLVLYTINNYEEGIREFDTVINIAPEMASAWVNRGKGRLKVNDYHKAAIDFEKAVSLHRTDTTAYLNLALARYHLGDLQGCIEANTELIRLSENGATGYFNRGIAYGKLNEFAKAISDFSNAIEIDPNYNEAHFNLGLAYYWSGDIAKACQSWEMARQTGSPKAGGVIEKYCN